MRSVLAVVAVALVALLVFAPVTSAQQKWVRGTVVSAGGDTLVVKVQGKDITFKVDKSTEVTARGAGTAQRKAEASGKEGIKFTDFVKPGGGVEVHYKDVGGVMTATEVFTGLTVGEGAAPVETTGGSARGAVTAVTGTSVTVKGEKEWTFTIDPKTSMVGQGLGTITRQFKEQNKNPTPPDLLKVNDKVIVYYQEAAGALKATEIRVTEKAK
jgi:hypothetical protein